MEIVIADDNEIELLVLEQALKSAGYKVVPTRNGHEALDYVLTNGARMVISDWEMPVMSGTELCHAIRTAMLPAYVYIVLLTGHNLPSDRVEGLSAGADDFIAKPFDKEELIARVHSGERVLSLETRDVAIFALAKLAESRDPDTGAHLERVRCFSRVLAQQLAVEGDFAGEIDADFIRLIYLTSPLHDIGKVGIPDRVLLKPGKLTNEEFDVMKKHTLLGANTLDATVDRFPSVNFLRMARDIARSHHERFDSSGYPDALEGKNIPLCARIVTVADVYDALTTQRVYKPAFSHKEAKQAIHEGSGSHFDPRVVKAFDRAEAQFIAIRKRFANSDNNSLKLAA